MATKKVGVLIKEARTAADLTQEKLAAKLGASVSASDVSKVERGEADFTNAQLKEIAKLCGVTQASLLNAPKNISEAAKKKAAKAESKSESKTAKKTDAKKTSSKAASKTESKTASKAESKAAKKPAVPASANTSMKVTSTEKKLVEAYRLADSDLKKAAMKLLKGEYGDTITGLLSSTSSASGTNGLADLITEGLGKILSGKK